MSFFILLFILFSSFPVSYVNIIIDHGNFVNSFLLILETFFLDIFVLILYLNSRR